MQGAVLFLYLLVALSKGHGLAIPAAAEECTQHPPRGADREQHGEWRMEATAHVASLVIRDMYCKLEPGKPCNLPADVKVGLLKEWASQDPGWDRILSSLSLYELSRRFWQQQDYERALVAVEQSLALKLSPYTDMRSLKHWQQSLVMPGQLFKRLKLEMADTLILKANCMYELGRRERSVEYLYQALEAIHLSAALMHSSKDLVPEVLSHLESLSRHVGSTAASVLSRMKAVNVAKLMGRYGIDCPACSGKGHLLLELIYRLALPVKFVAGSSSRLEVVEQPFLHKAYAQQPYESIAEFTQRFFAQLVGMVHNRFLHNLQVPCSHASPEGVCLSYLPNWVYSDTTALAAGSASTGPQLLFSIRGADFWLDVGNGDIAAPPAAQPDSPPASVGKQPWAWEVLSSSLPGYVPGPGTPGTLTAWTAMLMLDKLEDTLPPFILAATQQVSCAEESALAAAAAAASPAPPSGQEGRLKAAALDPAADVLLNRHEVDRGPWSDVWNSHLTVLMEHYTSDIVAHDVHQFLTALDYLADTNEVDMALLSATTSGSSTMLNTEDTVQHSSLSSIPQSPTALDYRAKRHMCISSAEHAGQCSDILEHFDVLSGPPFSPPSPCMATDRLWPLDPLPFKPSPPVAASGCPSYRQRLDLGVGGGGSWTSPAAAKDGLTDSFDGLAADFLRAASAAMADADSGPLLSQVDAIRHVSDRQLQEQLSRQERDSVPSYLHAPDSPLVVLTLALAGLAAISAALGLKSRRRLGRFLGGGVVGLHLLPGVPARDMGASVTANVTRSAAAIARLPLALAQRHAAAAALRDAMASGTAEKLEVAIGQGEAAMVEDPLLLRARVLLRQRHKEERKKEKQVAKVQARDVMRNHNSSSSKGAKHISHSPRSMASTKSVGGQDLGSDDGRSESVPGEQSEAAGKASRSACQPLRKAMAFLLRICSWRSHSTHDTFDNDPIGLGCGCDAAAVAHIPDGGAHDDASSVATTRDEDTRDSSIRHSLVKAPASSLGSAPPSPLPPSSARASSSSHSSAANSTDMASDQQQRHSGGDSVSAPVRVASLCAHGGEDGCVYADSVSSINGWLAHEEPHVLGEDEGWQLSGKRRRGAAGSKDKVQPTSTPTAAPCSRSVTRPAAIPESSPVLAQTSNGSAASWLGTWFVSHGAAPPPAAVAPPPPPPPPPPLPLPNAKHSARAAVATTSLVHSSSAWPSLVHAPQGDAALLTSASPIKVKAAGRPAATADKATPLSHTSGSIASVEHVSSAIKPSLPSASPGPSPGASFIGALSHFIHRSEIQVPQSAPKAPPKPTGHVIHSQLNPAATPFSPPPYYKPTTPAAPNTSALPQPSGLPVQAPSKFPALPAHAALATLAAAANVKVAGSTAAVTAPAAELASARLSLCRDVDSVPDPCYPQLPANLLSPTDPWRSTTCNTAANVASPLSAPLPQPAAAAAAAASTLPYPMLFSGGSLWSPHSAAASDSSPDDWSVARVHGYTKWSMGGAFPPPSVQLPPGFQVASCDDMMGTSPSDNLGEVDWAQEIMRNVID